MDVLFAGGDISGVLETQKRRLAEEIQSQDADYVLNVSETDLIEHFVSKYTVDVPLLREDAIYVASRDEAKIDVSGNPFRHFSAAGV